MRSPLLAAAAAGALVLFTAAGAEAQTPLTTKRAASDFTRPVYVCWPPDDFERMFVVEQQGKIKIVKNKVALVTPFLDVDLLSACCGERGLLGMAFHPNYAQNGKFYINYTDNGGDTVIAEYTVSGNPDIADPGSATIVFGPYFQPFSNHNGGGLQFSPKDGMLYCGMGDGGSGNDPQNNAQKATTALGKMLRLNVDIPFPHIPVDNPFLGGATGDDLAWSYGQRNPWRFSFDSETGDLYIGDVGQSAQEEVSFTANGDGGTNHGWRCMEGFDCTGLTGCTCNGAGLTLPLWDYSNLGFNNRCTVVGGYVYRGCAVSDLLGEYFFGDYCKFKVWSFQTTGTGAAIPSVTNRTMELTPSGGVIDEISSFAEDNFGELYIVDMGNKQAGNGKIWKIVPEALVDCNDNLIEDSCEIAFGLESDCNLNGVPDSCETLTASYCTAGTSASGCNATLSATGVPSASAASGFTVDGTGGEGSKDGIFFYGLNGKQANSWGNGTSYQCVVPPVIRTPLVSGGGTAGVCDGDGFSRDMNSFWSTAVPSKVPSPGTQVHLQLWYRDPLNTSNQTTSLSDGLEFWVCP